jgi:hypothetical protein
MYSVSSLTPWSWPWAPPIYFHLDVVRASKLCSFSPNPRCGVVGQRWLRSLPLRVILNTSTFYLVWDYLLTGQPREAIKMIPDPRNGSARSKRRNISSCTYRVVIDLLPDRFSSGCIRLLWSGENAVFSEHCQSISA